MTSRSLLHATSGPHRLYVWRLPCGVVLDFSHRAEALLIELARAYDEDPEGVGEDLTRLAELAAPSADRDELDAWVEALLDQWGGADQHLYGEQVRRLAETLTAAAEPATGPEKDTPSAGGESTAVTEAYPGELENLRTLRRDVERATSQRPIDDPVVVALIDHLSYAPMVDATLAALTEGGEGQ